MFKSNIYKINRLELTNAKKKGRKFTEKNTVF